VAPLSLFPIILESWILPTDFYTLNESTYLVLFLLGLLALSVLGLLLSGIISASKFGYLGGIRASSQRVRYEISLSLVLFSLQALSESFQWSSFTIAIFLFPLWFISIVAEVRRAPLDFSEGESELISGFNVEFGSSLFILIFLREYGIVLSFSFLTSVLFFGGRVMLAGILSLSILLLRASFPRFRYDYLIGLCWLVILPLSIIILCIVFIVKDCGVLSGLGGCSRVKLLFNVILGGCMWECLAHKCNHPHEKVPQPNPHTTKIQIRTLKTPTQGRYLRRGIIILYIEII